MNYEQLIKRCRELFPEFSFFDDVTLLENIQHNILIFMNGIPESEWSPIEKEKVALIDFIDEYLC